jgi:hypothetical protein
VQKASTLLSFPTDTLHLANIDGNLFFWVLFSILVLPRRENFLQKKKPKRSQQQQQGLRNFLKNHCLFRLEQIIQFFSLMDDEDVVQRQWQ